MHDWVFNYTRKAHYYGENGEDAFDIAQILGNQIDNELLI